jgi:hypothetical protein
MFVITADQVDSRREADRVPEALTLLAEIRPSTSQQPFERTAGDEIQGVSDPADVLDIVGSLIRPSGGAIGIGIGPVDLPLPESPRAGRGPAFIAARDRRPEAHPVPGQLAVRAGRPPELHPSVREVRERHTRYAESALLLYARLLRARTPEGWEVTDLWRGIDPEGGRCHGWGSARRRSANGCGDRGGSNRCGAASSSAHHLSVADGRTDP